MKSAGKGDSAETRLLGPRVREAEAAGVEQLPADRTRPRELGPVDAVSHDRVPGGGEVNPDLMGPAGLGPNANVGGAGEPFDRLEPRDRALAFLARPRDRAAQPGLAHEIRVEGAPRRQGAFHQRDVLAVDRVAPEALLEGVERGAIAREDQRPRGLLVQTVHDACVGAAAVAVLEVVDGAGPERVLLARLGRHGQESGGLVDDQDVGVLVEHREASAHRAANRAPGMERDLGIRRDGVPGLLNGHAAHVDLAAPHRLARGPARQRESLRDGLVQPHRFAPCGTRTSTKKSGSPIRASGRAPGP